MRQRYRNPCSAAHFGSGLPQPSQRLLYVFERDALTGSEAGTQSWISRRDLLPDLLSAAWSCLWLSGLPGRWTRAPERLDAGDCDWRSGRIARGSLSTPVPAIFLDRDGTINALVDYVRTPDELELLDADAPFAGGNPAGWRVVVVSNQPVIARGECAVEGLLAIHNRMETLLGRDSAYVDRIYYCPHHPDGGFPDERPELKFRCDCRKPATGLIERARGELNIDVQNSWMVGDSTTDIRTARNAGLRSILLRREFAAKTGFILVRRTLSLRTWWKPCISPSVENKRPDIDHQPDAATDELCRGRKRFPNCTDGMVGRSVSTTIDKFIYIAVNGEF